METWQDGGNSQAAGLSPAARQQSTRDERPERGLKAKRPIPTLEGSTGQRRSLRGEDRCGGGGGKRALCFGGGLRAPGRAPGCCSPSQGRALLLLTKAPCGSGSPAAVGGQEPHSPQPLVPLSPLVPSALRSLSPLSPSSPRHPSPSFPQPLLPSSPSSPHSPQPFIPSSPQPLVPSDPSSPRPLRPLSPSSPQPAAGGLSAASG